MTKLQKLQKFLSVHIPYTSWNYKGYEGLDYPDPLTAQQDWNRTLITKINQISANIFKDTQLDIGGGSNAIIYSLGTKYVLESLDNFPKDVTSLHGYTKIGVLVGRYTVFFVPDLTKIKQKIYITHDKLEEIDYNEKKIFVCRLKDVNKSIFDLKNYIKVGVLEITEW